ncbi:hypothetical protein ACSFC1_09430 [Pseudothermotoga sp. U03pept]|uniref:hypothetical protein n=1 Tax=Pseudothermotoga sp. U03pept TaxID=3447012 RepID=UPI003F0C9AA2
MKVGFSSVILSFPTGLEMAGYVLRKGVSIGCHDPLELFCVYLSDDEIEVALVVFDLLSVPERLPNQVNGVNLIPIATHTHSAPKPNLVAEIIESCTKESLIEAKKKATEIEEIVVRKGKISGVCDLRNKPGSEQIPVNHIHFRTAMESFSILLFSCHPTVLGPENLLYSADLAGGIRRKLSLREGRPVLFMNSCCGNVSTHRTRRNRSFAEIERLTEIFTDHLHLEEAYRIPYPRSLVLKNVDFVVNFVTKNLSNLSLNDRDTPGAMLARQRGVLPTTEKVRISFLTIESLKFVFVPFELFIEFSTQQVFAEKPVFIVCYANSAASYVVPKDVHSGYEWVVSPYSDETEERLLGLIDRELFNP